MTDIVPRHLVDRSEEEFVAQETAGEAPASPTSASGAETAERTGSPGGSRLRSVARYGAFPVVVLAVLLVFAGLALHGSSIGILGDVTREDPSLVAGDFRSIRGDEYLIQTPNSIGNVRRGLPQQPWFGLVQVRQPVVTLGAPSRYWAEAFRPQNWGYFADAPHGLAWHWWFSFAAAMLGVFALLALLMRSALLPAVLAVVAALTPYTGWWSSPSTAMLLGFAAGGTACALAALRARRAAAAVVFAAGCGYLLAALGMTLYPPWVISTALVGVAVVIGQAVDQRVRLRRFGLVAGVAVLTAATPLAVWALQNRDAIRTTAETFYPGSRLSEAGQAWLANLLSAPLNPWLAGGTGRTLAPEPGATGYASYVNLSESASSWIPLGVLAVLVLLVAAGQLLGRRRAADAEVGEQPRTGTFWAVTAVTALLLAWALLPLPGWVGTVTFLNRVPPWRTPLAIGFGALLMVALASELLRGRPLGRPRAALLALGAGLTVLATLWSAGRLQWDESLVSLPLVALSGLAVGAGFAVIASGRLRVVAAVVLAAYCACSWALVNPLYRGLGPLQNDDLVKAMEQVERESPGTVAAVYGNFRVVAMVASSGVQSLSGVTFYPDHEVMQRLAPGQRDLWNNYASYRWVADPAQDPAEIVQIQGTNMELHIDPCAPQTLSLGMTWAVSDKPLDLPCLTPVDVVDSRGAGQIHRYRVVRP